MVAISGSGWKLAPSLVAYVNEANRYFPNRDKTSDGSIGDLAHQSRVSDHNPDDGWVHAVDLDEDLSATIDLKRFAEQLRYREDSRIKYVIYEGRMFASYNSSNGPAWIWRDYDGINGHFYHLHVSILHTDKARNDLSPWGFEYITSPPPKPPSNETSDTRKGDHLDILAVEDISKSYAVMPDGTVELTPQQILHLVSRGANVIKTTKGMYDALTLGKRDRNFTDAPRV